MPRRIAEERRAGILAAVAETLQEEGLPFPSYDRVAGHAALSRQLVRHYFPDPEELMVTACRSLGQAWLSEIARRLNDAPPGTGLGRLIDLCLDGRGAEDDLPPPAAFESLIALSRSSPALRGALQAEVEALTGIFSEEVARAFPDLAAREARELALLIVSQVVGHWAMAGTLELGAAEGRAARLAIDGIIAAYTGAR